MTTDPSLLNREVQVRFGEEWVSAVVSEVNGGSVAVTPLPQDAAGPSVFPDGTNRRVLALPAEGIRWRY